MLGEAIDKPYGPFRHSLARRFDSANTIDRNLAIKVFFIYQIREQL
jgi:hypothetical protein